MPCCTSQLAELNSLWWEWSCGPSYPGHYSEHPELCWFGGCKLVYCMVQWVPPVTGVYWKTNSISNVVQCFVAAILENTAQNICEHREFWWIVLTIEIHWDGIWRTNRHHLQRGWLMLWLISHQKHSLWMFNVYFFFICLTGVLIEIDWLISTSNAHSSYAHRARAGPGWSQDNETLLGSPTWVAAARALGHLLLQDACAGSPIECSTTRT